MMGFLKRLRKNERGNVLVIAAATMPLLIGSAGLATDTIQWALWKRQLQRAADSAAIAGVRERINSGTTTGVSAMVAHDIAINQHTGISLNVAPAVTFPGDQGQMVQQVRVVLEVQKPLTFSSMFMSSAPIIRAGATAASVPGTDDFCVISLENTTAMGIQGSGNGTVETDCSWITNSVAAVAAMAKGSSSIWARVIAAAGGIQESNNFHVDRYDPYTPQIDDPYADLAPESADMKCATAPGKHGELNPVTLTGGTSMAQFRNADGSQKMNCFAGIDVGSNTTLDLGPGVFYIDGGNVNVQGTLTCTGCTIVLTNSSSSPTATIGNFDANASGNVRITAPSEGKWAGMAIYQDRRAQDKEKLSSGNMPANAPNKINGNSVSYIEGVLYFPRQQLTYNGNGNGNWRCTQFVARRIQFSGNNTSKFTSGDTCDGTLPPDATARRVRLVA